MIELARKTQGNLGVADTVHKVVCADFGYRPKDAVAAMIKRLAHRNANVQLYTLEVGRDRSKRATRADVKDSLRMLFPRIVAQECTAN